MLRCDSTSHWRNHISWGGLNPVWWPHVVEPSGGSEYSRRARCGKTARRDLCGGCLGNRQPYRDLCGWATKRLFREELAHTKLRDLLSVFRSKMSKLNQELRA